MIESLIPNCLKGMNKIHMPKGTVVFEPGSNCNQFAYILSGKIRVDLLGGRGKPIMLYRFGGGETCILTTSCLLSGDTYNATATIEEDVEAIVVPMSQFDAMLTNSSEFRQIVFHSFSERLSTMMVKIEQIAFVPVEQRLAERLTQLPAQNGQFIQITHDQLAADIGTAREVISRKLKLWEKQGIVIRNRGQISIINLQALEQISCANVN